MRTMAIKTTLYTSLALLLHLLDTSTMSTIDVKLLHAATGQTRIVSLPTEPAPTWTDLVQHIQQRFSLEQAPTRATYVDDDGDEITLSTDDELRELWLGSAAELRLTLSFSVARLVHDHEHERVRDAEQKALLDSVRDALEQDASLAHDLREVVHDVLGAPHHPHPRHHHHPYSHSGSRRGRSGRHGFGGGHRHERWERRSRSRTLEGDSSSGDSSGSDSDTDKEQGGERRCGPGGRRRGKHGERASSSTSSSPSLSVAWLTLGPADGHSPPRHRYPGTPPPPPHPRHGHHGRHGAPMPPPPPPPHGPLPPLAFNIFPPPPPPPFSPHGGRHGVRRPPPPFFAHGPPPTPLHGTRDGVAPFAERDPYSMAPWHALVDCPGSPFGGMPHHRHHSGARHG